MQVKIAWKTLDNVQLKTFKDELSCIAWCRNNAENIMSINGIPTGRNKLSHFDVKDCLEGVGILSSVKYLDIINR